MTLYTRSGFPLNFTESEKAWNNPNAICSRLPSDIAVDGQCICYVCGHALDEHKYGENCRVCVALSKGIHSPDMMTGTKNKLRLANQRKPLIERGFNSA